MKKIITPNWPAPKNIVAFTTTRQIDADLHQLSFPNSPIWLNQVHGNKVVDADSLVDQPDADASFSIKKNTVCVVRTADCLPILLTDIEGTFVAAIHAGWRGLAKNIIKSTVSKIKSKHMIAWLGPAIGPDAFEVGDDVYSAFPGHSTAFMKKDGKWLANIYTIARQQLNELGIEQIFGGEYCTYSDPELFYSYRRDKTPNRMASFIWASKT